MSNPEVLNKKKHIRTYKSFRAFIVYVLFFLVGASPWIAEKVIADQCENVDEIIGEEHMSIIYGISGEYGICPELLESICYYESRGDEKAVASNGVCVGAFQTNYKYSTYSKDELMKFSNSCYDACRILTELFEEYEGDCEAVLCAYNCGAYSKTLKKLIEGEITWGYSNKVLKLSERLEYQHGKKDYREYFEKNAVG